MDQAWDLLESIQQPLLSFSAIPAPQLRDTGNEVKQGFVRKLCGSVETSPEEDPQRGSEGLRELERDFFYKGKQ